MTLLLTEIHPFNIPIDPPFIVFAADRRISRGDNYDDTREKIFRIPILNAGIGYFGLAEIPKGNVRRPMSEYITEYINSV